MPVVPRLLLVLPDGELHDYLCQRCGSSIGQKREKKVASAGGLILPS